MGYFITIEGVEGSGKTSQLACLVERMRPYPTFFSREPGGTELGREVRKLLLTPHSSGESWCGLAELFLFYADRAQHVETKIKPALAQGQHVILDRFNDSTWAYQGARGVSDEILDQMANMALGHFKPDMTLVLDIDPRESLQRVASRNAFNDSEETRFDNEILGFHLRVRERFLKLHAREPERVVLIDASAPQEVVAAKIWGCISNLIGVN